MHLHYSYHCVKHTYSYTASYRIAGIFEDNKFHCFRGFHCYLENLSSKILL